MPVALYVSKYQYCDRLAKNALIPPFPFFIQQTRSVANGAIKMIKIITKIMIVMIYIL